MRPPSRKTSWSRPLADFVGAAVDPVLARRGFGEADLISHWDDIVGERLAATCRPIGLAWPRRRGQSADAPQEPATLTIRVEGAFALDLQHMADQVLARINAHLGWRCVGRLVLKQGPIERVERVRARAAPTAQALAAVAGRMPPIDDAGLHAALARLGAHVLK